MTLLSADWRGNPAHHNPGEPRIHSGEPG